MTATTKPSADGLVFAVCPKTDCGATLRIVPKSARTNVTCASCGHRFKLEVPNGKTPSTPAGQSLAFDEASPSTHSHTYRRKSSPVGPIVAAGIAVILLVGGTVGGIYAFRNQKPNTEEVAQTTLPKTEKVNTTSVTTKTPPTRKSAPPSITPPVEPRIEPPIVEPKPIIIPPTRDEILARVKKSTALIESKSGWGTGFVAAPGLIVTNAHVLAGRPISDITVSFVSLDDTDPPKLKVVLLHYDAARDLAILRVDTDRPALEMTAPGTELSKMEVAVVGNPRDAARQAEINKVTIGTLSAPIRRDAGWTYYELHAEAFFGNSGGPVVDINTGKLVGVMQSIFGDGKAKSYCIPFGEAKRALDLVAAAKDRESSAIKIVAGRHALDSIATRLPEIEKQAKRAMDVQCTLLRIKSQKKSSLYRLEDGTILSQQEILDLWTEVKKELDKSHAEIQASFKEKFAPVINSSPEIPQLLKEVAVHRIGTCAYMQELARSTTRTEDGFQKEIERRRTASDNSVKAFDTAYKPYLETAGTKPARAK